MAEASKARWHGDNYQARIFWENALNLLEPTSCVVEVSFEANGPKAFDDVVVRYDPPVAGPGPERISAEYQQIKWHVDTGGRFGYEDLIDPAFIGASSVSLLQRLVEAQRTAPPKSWFGFLTVYRIRDEDPLASLISATSRSILLERLFEGRTDRSRMGKVRKVWREHLQISSDDELRPILSRFKIIDGYRTLDELRSQITFKARAAGLLTSAANTSDFRFDELARQLKVRDLNRLTRESLERVCRDEGIWGSQPPANHGFLPVAIHSFVGSAADAAGATPENTLILVDDFTQRYLRDDRDWQHDIQPKVESFLRTVVSKSRRLRLFMDAHASIAFLAGKVLDLKAGVDVELIQKGRVGVQRWTAADGTAGPDPTVSFAQIGSGAELAVAISVTHSVEAQAQSYIASHLPQIGTMLTVRPPGGPSQQTVAGGAHAAKISEKIVNAVRERRGTDVDARVHVFAACPNSVLFFLGQSHQGIAPCIIYEYDFDRLGSKTYQPSFPIP